MFRKVFLYILGSNRLIKVRNGFLSKQFPFSDIGPALTRILKILAWCACPCQVRRRPKLSFINKTAPTESYRARVTELGRTERVRSASGGTPHKRVSCRCMWADEKQNWCGRSSPGWLIRMLLDPVRPFVPPPPLSLVLLFLYSLILSSSRSLVPSFSRSLVLSFSRSLVLSFSSTCYVSTAKWKCIHQVALMAFPSLSRDEPNAWKLVAREVSQN